MNIYTAGTYAEQMLKSWHPSHNWQATVRAAYRQITKGKTARRSFKGWAQLAAMLGDCGASPLCLMVCLYGQSLLPRGHWDKQLTGYMNISLLALGLAEPRYDRTLLIKNIGNPDTIDIKEQQLQQWLNEQLAPFAGDLKKAALFCLRLSALRTGVVGGPQNPIIAQILNDAMWSDSNQNALAQAKCNLWQFVEKLNAHEAFKY